MSGYHACAKTEEGLRKLLERIEVHVQDGLPERYPRDKEGAPMHDSVRALLARERISSKDPEWGKARKLMLTASDVGAVLGHSKYESRDSVMLKKTGKGKQFQGNKFTAHGQHFEDEAGALYSLVMGIELIPEDIGLLRLRNHPFLGATPDRVAKCRDLLIEIKCPYSRKIDGKVPPHYLDQVYLQMKACEIYHCHFVEYRPPDFMRHGELWITEIRYREDWWVRAFPVLKRFWEDVEQMYRNQLHQAMEVTAEEPVLPSTHTNIGTHCFAIPPESSTSRSGRGAPKKRRRDGEGDDEEPAAEPCVMVTHEEQRQSELFGCTVILDLDKRAQLAKKEGNEQPPACDYWKSVNVYGTPTEFADEEYDMRMGAREDEIRRLISMGVEIVEFEEP